MRRWPAALSACLASVGMAGAAAGGDDEQGARWVAGVSLGAGVNAAAGDAPRAPRLLVVSPELSFTGGLALADRVVVFVRLDMLGAMIPILGAPAGGGLDLGFTVATALADRDWRPTFGGSVGGLVFGVGGEPAGEESGTSWYGLRGRLEGGMARSVAIPSGADLRLGVLVGVQASWLSTLPCDAGCGHIRLGPSVRGDLVWLF